MTEKKGPGRIPPTPEDQPRLAGMHPVRAEDVAALIGRADFSSTGSTLCSYRPLGLRIA